jgi:hypothetical protein
MRLVLASCGVLSALWGNVAVAAPPVTTPAVIIAPAVEARAEPSDEARVVAHLSGGDPSA